MKKPGAANSSSGLRGDYSQSAADFTTPQDWAAYSAQEHERWRRLYARQHALAERFAARQVLDGLRRLDASNGIPDFNAANRVLEAATGWNVVAVPGFIPDAVFFDHLAHRRFPVSRWLREEHELDYLVEPDVFHDFFGHVPMLLDPVFADFMVKYGEAGPRAIAMNALDMLARVYWYTVEFGLIDEGGGLKAFGAGILSSAGETVYAVTDPHVPRLPFDPARIMRTAYAIDSFQKVYFVIGSVEELMRGLVDLDFGPIYEEWHDKPPLPAGEVQTGEQVWQARREET